MAATEISPPYINIETHQLERANVPSCQKAGHHGSLQENGWQTPTLKAHQSKRKAKRKNDSLIAVISQWIVDHQVGTFKPIFPLSRLTQYFRSGCQSAPSIGYDAFVLSSGPSKYLEILSALLLQSIDGQIHAGAG